MPQVPLPPAQQLIPRVDEIGMSFGERELTLSKLSFTSSSASGQVVASASGTVSVRSISIAPALMGNSPSELAGWIEVATRSALLSANGQAKAEFLAAAGLLAFPELPAPATFEPPLYDGFATGVSSLLAQATELEPQIRVKLFEGQAGPVVAVVDGQLGLQSVTITRDLNESAVELGLMATTAINEAIEKAKRLSDVGVKRVTDAVVGRRGFHPALFVADSRNLSGSDQALVDRLSSLGFSVSVSPALSVQGADADGKAIVVISETTFSPDVGDRLSGVAVPMLVMEPALFDSLGMTGDVWDTDQGEQLGQTSLTITDPAHPLAAGLQGTITVTSAPTKFVWGAPSTASVKIAGIQGRANAFGIFAYSAGAQMVGQTAPANRIGWFAGRSAPSVLSTNGWRLFDAAVRWLTSSVAVLVVKEEEPLSLGDLAIRARLCHELGFLVDVRRGQDVQASHTESARLVVISESTESASLLDRLKNISAPTLIMEPALFDDFKLTGAGWQTDIGDALNKISVNIDLPASPLAAGLSGAVTVASSPGKMVWGKPADTAMKVASIPGITGASAIFAYEKGAVMKDNFVAPGRRVGWFAGREMPVTLTSNGWSLFDAAVRWSVQKRALLVVNAVPLSSGDSRLFARLRDQFGFVVEVVTGSAVQTSHTVGVQLVLVSESTDSGTVGDRLKSVTVPVVCLEPALLDDFGMTGGSWQNNIGDFPGQTTISITNGVHPMAAGLSGNVVVASQPSNFVWGQPASAAVKVAYIAGQPTKWAAFGYEKAAQMSTMAAPERRVGFFLHRDTPLYLTADGWRLFDAAVSWASKLSTVQEIRQLEFVDLFGR